MDEMMSVKESSSLKLDRSRPLTARPLVWYLDHPPTSHGNFQFRKIFMGRHLLPGLKKRKKPSGWTEIIFSHSSFKPLSHVLRAEWVESWTKSYKSHKIITFHHRRDLVGNRLIIARILWNNESLMEQTPMELGIVAAKAIITINMLTTHASQWTPY